MCSSGKLFSKCDWKVYCKELFNIVTAFSGAELDQIKGLFNEKEKELSLAVGKVDELSRQLEDIRKGRLNGFNVDSKLTTPALVELEKLRKELLVSIL